MKPQNMTDKELNDKVGELLGWKYGPCGCGAPACDKSERWQDPVLQWHDELPNFTFDLNAMHGAEATIPDNDGAQGAYHAALCKVTNWAPVHCSISQAKANFDLIRATARQRAEAFVIAMSRELHQ